MSEGSSGSPLKGEMGNTTISSTVVSQIAGIAAQEAEDAQMGGGASAAVGGFLQSVTGSVTGSVGELLQGCERRGRRRRGRYRPDNDHRLRPVDTQYHRGCSHKVINRVESLTGLRVTEVNIIVNDVQIPEQQPALDAVATEITVGARR